MVAILLTGCASGASTASPSAIAPTPSTSSAKPSVTPTATEAAASREDKIKALYLAGVRDGQPGLASAGDDDMITIGQGFCKMYEGGATGSDVNNYILKAAGWAYTVPQLVSMHGAAVGAFCSQYIDEMGK